MRDTGEITDDDLHAYIDGALDRRRRLDIALRLAGRPLDAAKVQVFLAQKEAIHLLFDDVLGQSPPQSLKRLFAQRALKSVMHRCLLAAAAAGTGALVLLASGVGQHMAHWRETLTSGTAMHHERTGERPVNQPPAPEIKHRNQPI